MMYADGKNNIDQMKKKKIKLIQNFFKIFKILLNKKLVKI